MLKKKIKIIVDALMTIIFVLLMCRQITGVFTHEILGVAVIVLFIIHQILNINYYKGLLKGKYNRLRTAYLIIDILLLIMMIVMIISAIFISQDVFKFLNLGNELIGRNLHNISVYTIYVLIGLHMGLHYNSIIKNKNTRIVANVFLGLMGLLFGINGFIKKKFIEKITLKLMYPLYSEENIIVFLLDYIGILLMFVMIGYIIYCLATWKKQPNKDRKAK